jgi:hypothetical protein
MKPLLVVALVAVAGCGAEEKRPPVTPTPPKAEPRSEKEVTPAPKSEPEVAPAPANPAIAEFAPLWPEIAKCDELWASNATPECSAKFKLLETVKAAYEGRDKDRTRLRQVHEALVDQVVNGKDLKSRLCAAYAASSKPLTGGTPYGGRTEADAKHALALLEALKKLEKEEKDLGDEIAHMLAGWWEKDSEVRKAMTAVLGDKSTKSTGGRSMLMRYARQTAKENAELVPILKSVATDTGENASVRATAINGLSSLAGDLPELVDLFLGLTGDANAHVLRTSVRALGSAKPGTDAGKKAQAKLLELALAGTEADTATGALGKVGDLEALATFSKHYKSNAGKPEVIGAMRSAISGYVSSGRFKEDATADAAFRMAIDAVLEDKDADKSALRDMLDALGELGGKKSEATCKKYMEDKIADVAAAATKCVEKSAPAK